MYRRDRNYRLGNGVLGWSEHEGCWVVRDWRDGSVALRTIDVRDAEEMARCL